MYFRQPRYYGDFHCVGTSCPDNCCRDWRIDWTKEEVDKLKAAETPSPLLKELIDKSFAPNNTIEGAYKIVMDDKDSCPFLTEEGLCRIQKELGVEYMSQTCTIYPRKRLIADQTIYNACCSSCREIMRHIMNDENAMDLINVQIKNNGKPQAILLFSPEEIAAHPEFKYHGELIEFFYEIIADKRHDVETNIILGALAAQALTKLVDNGGADKIPETLKQLKSQMHNAAQLKAIENIKPNYHLRFGIIGKLLEVIAGYSMIGALNDKTGTPNIDLYDAASKNLNEIFKDRPFYLRNIALNLLLELFVPFSIKEKTIFENYSLFAVTFACVKLNLIAVALNGKDDLKVRLYSNEIQYIGEEKYPALTAVVCRGLCQNIEKQKYFIKVLNDNKFTSPAYIALLVK